MLSVANCRWEVGYIASKGTQGIAPPELLSLLCLLQKMTGHSLLFGFLFVVAFCLFPFFICNTELLSSPPTPSFVVMRAHLEAMVLHTLLSHIKGQTLVNY